MAIRHGGRQAVSDACQDLVLQTAENQHLIGFVIHDLEDIATTMVPNLPAADAWLAIREYLKGIIDPLQLPGPVAPKDLSSLR